MQGEMVDGNNRGATLILVSAKDARPGSRADAFAPSHTCNCVFAPALANKSVELRALGGQTAPCVYTQLGIPAA